MNLCIVSSSLIDANKTIHSTQENVDAVNYLLQTMLQSCGSRNHQKNKDKSKDDNAGPNNFSDTTE
jgi:hypothetical protein